MFDKDKEYGLRLDQEVDLRENFVLWEAKVTEGDVMPTALGEAMVARLVIQHLNQETGRAVGDKIEVNTVASSIVEKAQEAEADDFPAVCRLMKVPSKKHDVQALVLRFVGPYAPTGGTPPAE